MNPDTLDKRIKTNGNRREHPIGILYYKFNSLDTNALQDHLLDTLANGQFTDVANRPRSPYFTHYSFLAAPLFVTNIIDEDAYLIADWYKQRWEIEVFFKFIKQHLNVNHLVSGNINGIKVMIYMTMILAILIISYKKINRIKGFKIAKLKFELELETEIMKAVVTEAGAGM